MALFSGTLAATSTQEDCIVVVETLNADTGEAFDVSGATIVCEVRDPDNRSIVISATTSNGGITITGSSTFQIWLTRVQMQGLSEGQYDIGCVVTLNGQTQQIFVATLPVIDGIVTQ